MDVGEGGHVCGGDGTNNLAWLLIVYSKRVGEGGNVIGGGGGGGGADGSGGGGAKELAA